MQRSRRALTFLARERRPVNQRSKKFETVSSDRTHRKRLEIANRFHLNDLRFSARAQKFVNPSCPGSLLFLFEIARPCGQQGRRVKKGSAMAFLAAGRNSVRLSMFLRESPGLGQGRPESETSQTLYLLCSVWFTRCCKIDECVVL